MLYFYIQSALASCISMFAAHMLVREYHSFTRFFSLKTLLYSILCIYTSFCFYIIALEYGSESYTFVFAWLVSITLFTDAFALLISDIITLWCIPLIWILAYTHHLSVSLQESIIAACSTFFICKAISYITQKWFSQEALGAGDASLLAFLAAYLGYNHTWFAMTIGSCCGALYGILCILRGHNKKTLQLPFGTFLCIGTLCVLMWTK